MASQRARELAAQAWCTEANKNTVMDTKLTEAFADILDKEWYRLWSELNEFSHNQYPQYK